MNEVTQVQFHADLHKTERARNAGCTTTYKDAEDETHWFVAGSLFGVSDGRLGTNTLYRIAV